MYVIILGWPMCSFGFSLNILWKISNECFDQPNINCMSLKSWALTEAVMSPWELPYGDR